MGGRTRLVVFAASLSGFAVLVVSCGAEQGVAPPVVFHLPQPVAARSAAADTRTDSAAAGEPSIDASLPTASGAAAAGSTAVRLAPPVPAVTFAFTGDNLTHSPIVEAARVGTGFDFTPMFADIAPVVAWADVAVCHLETPVAPAGEALSTYPQYGVPADITTSLAAVGYDRCSTASNHTMDRGVAGIDATVNALEAAGLGQSGMARTPAEAQPLLFAVHGVTFAHLSFTFGLNGARLPPDEPWRSNLLSADGVIAAARDARARGAQVVIASLHWGNEGSSLVTPEQRTIAEQVTASGTVDLIVGHHAHVLQPIEQINGRWVLFGLGNILSNLPTPTGRAWPPSTQDGAIVVVSIARAADGTVVVSRPAVVPTWVDKNARWRIRLVRDGLDDPSLPVTTRQQLAASLARTSAVLGEYVVA